MLKKYLTYVLLFVGCFAVGLLFAYGWQKLFPKKQAETHQVLPEPPAPARSLTTPVPPAVQGTPVTRPASAGSAQPAVKTAATASSPQPAQPSPEAQRGTTGSAVVILLDSSGSTTLSDAAIYGKDSAKLLITLLGPDDRIGILGIGAAAVMVSPLVENSQQNRKSLLAAIDKAELKGPANIGDAMQKGLAELKIAKQRDRVMFLVSGGTGSLAAGAPNGVSGLLSEVSRAGIKVFSAAVSAELDGALEHAARETGGASRFAKTSMGLPGAVALLFEKMKSPDAVPCEGGAFAVDGMVKDASVVVAKKPGDTLVLVDPLGRKHDASSHAANIAWFGSTVFDVVSIQGPAAGVWSMAPGVCETGRAYVATDLTLRTSFDRSIVQRGEKVKLDAWLDKNAAVVEQGFLEGLVFTADVTGPDGKKLQHRLISAATESAARGKDERYSVLVPVDAAGEYHVSLLAQGKTFKREKTRSFKALEAAAEHVPEKPASTAPVREPVHAQDPEVNWFSVIMRLLLVNITVAALAAGGYVLKKKIKPKKDLVE